MNVLILGAGGREHAFAWKIAQSKKLGNLFIAPGNAGTAHCGTNVNMAVTDFEAIKNFVWKNSIEMVVVGPEDPLVQGIYDFFKNDEVLKDIPVIGPSQAGAQLEGSKKFSKEFMQRYHIPTARYQTFTKETLAQGLQFLETLQAPYVLKADGLAAGKGVVIPGTLEEAKKELTEMLAQSKFGKASEQVVIEEFLHGIELSVFVLSDGKNYKILPSAKDYKRIGEGDTGLNTGGMGAISPVPFADADFLKKVETQIVIPTLQGLQQEQIIYQGFIFIGLMNCQGNPYVIEYNCRMGDPETEVVIPRIKTDLLALFEALAQQKLNEITVDVDARTAATVMLVSGGYPEAYEKNKYITQLEVVQNSLVFHAGTSEENGKILTNGGRVLALTSFGNSISEAVAQSLKNAAAIQYDKKYFRKDIGQDLITLEKQST
ncbi:MAG: phosphoribosylamine--glycine ligase [Bacteroidetes bacterium]|nr:phosphoribosylamine--glycine ligase [Bacteroidota bacterium]